MNRPHLHDPDCAPDCARTVDLCEETPTAAFRIVARRGYGHRHKHDKPRWWPFAFHAYKALIQLTGIAALAWVAKKCGLTIPGSGP
jgi:hypothetical protein